MGAGHGVQPPVTFEELLCVRAKVEIVFGYETPRVLRIRNLRPDSKVAQKAP